MHIGLSDAFGGSPARDATFIQEYAAKAESLGFESLWVPEHIVFFDHYDSRYPYNESGLLRWVPTPACSTRSSPSRWRPWPRPA